ncbi:MAG: beta-glucosidase [Ktedonobacterales bacterium]|nr:beta-glucosidase [Ktedonobacterales bacterium]
MAQMTIRDIARLAGVSAATVSRVLNHKPDVDPATRERILGLIKEMDYHPDHTAVVLASNKHHRAPAKLQFPPDFLWGVATSAFQIEGALRADGRGASIWDDYVAHPPPDFRPQTAEIACDHYQRMAEDVALLARLGVQAYRFSIAWPRIFPTGEGQINLRGLDFYERLVDALLAANISPLVTLYHWDLPLALQTRYQGWLHRDVAQIFADYAEQVARRLGDRVSWWTTVNEPWSIAVHGYVLGIHPPHQQDKGQALQAAHHMLLAHGLAVPRIRQHCRPAAKVGIALNLSPVYPADQREATAQAVRQADIWYNRWLLDPLFQGNYPPEAASQAALASVIQPQDLAHIATPIDFLGVNYYSRLVVQPATTPATDLLTGFTSVVPVPEASYSHMGWETYADGLQDILLRVHHAYHPSALLITENGAAFTDEVVRHGQLVRDQRRVAYLQEHIAAMQRAIQLGAPVRGYCAWTLMDNFEWVDGYQQHFGLASVAPHTLERTLKESGQWYAKFIATQRSGAVGDDSSATFAIGQARHNRRP